MKIIPRIGLWHVHGHQDSCYVCYASNFIPETSRMDGKIMETLWAPLNIISLSAKGIGTPYCKEVLDYQVNDCNFMKIICMNESLHMHIKLYPVSYWLTSLARFLCKKFKEAIKDAAESKLVFQNITKIANPDLVIL